MKLIIIFSILISFFNCNNQLKVKKTNNHYTNSITLKKLDTESINKRRSYNSGLEIYTYDSSYYKDEKLPLGLFDTKVGFSDSIIITLNYGMAHKSFWATTASLKVINKGVTVIDTVGSVKSMEKLYYNLFKKENLKPIKLNKYLNYKSDSIHFLKNYCDTLIKHYPTYKEDKIIRKKTNDNILFQFYYSGSEDCLKICYKEKNYDVKLGAIDTINRYSPTILLKDITGDGKEELFFAEKMRPHWWSYEGFYIDLYEINYPQD